MPTERQNAPCDHLGTDWVSEPLSANVVLAEHRCGRCGHVVLAGIKSREESDG